MSQIIILDSSQVPNQPSGNFTVNYPQPIKLRGAGDWEIALIRADLVNSFFNITATTNTNKMTYSPNSGVTVRVVTIPDGTYNIIDIERVLHDFMLTQVSGLDFDLVGGEPVFHIFLTPNFNTLRLEIVIDDADFEFDLTTGVNGDINRLFGHPSIKYTGVGTNVGTELVNITDDIFSILINVSIATDSWNNAQNKGALFSFVPSVPPGSAITLTVPKPIYTRIKRGDREVRNITVTITDQTATKIIDFNGEQVVLFCHVRPRQMLEFR